MGMGETLNGESGILLCQLLIFEGVHLLLGIRCDGADSLDREAYCNISSRFSASASVREKRVHSSCRLMESRDTRPGLT